MSSAGVGRRRGAGWLLGAAVVLLSGGVGVGCGASEDNAQAPVATLGSSIRAERELRPLVSRWTMGIERERQGLDGAFAGFVKRYRDEKGSEALVPLAQVFRALNALARQDLRQARDLAEPALLGPPGATRDLAVLVMGAAARRSGDHREALDRLSPLLHKMLDDFATSLLNEELVAAAEGAGDFALALRYMEIWRREADVGTEHDIDARIAELLERLPHQVLVDELERRRQLGVIDESVAIATALARRLARYTTEHNDSTLARLLLRYYGPLLGNTAVAVAKLSAEQNRGRVTGRTVGLVMSLAEPWQRRRSAELAAGLAWGLDLPGSDARLVSEPLGSEPDAADAALKRLAAQGASVVVGGVDADSARALAKAADQTALPLLLIDPATASSRSPFVFFVGQSSLESLDAIRTQLAAKGVQRLAAISDEFKLAPDQQLVASYSCAALPDAAALREAGVDGLALLDGSFCHHEVAQLAQLGRLPLGAGLGVAGRDKVLRHDAWLSAGLFPIDPSGKDARLAAWRKAGRLPPSWWTGLGRDAGVLAWAAVKDLSARTSDEREVEALRLQVSSKLAAARLPLWTSQAQGFNAERRIVRSHASSGGGRAVP